jgi:phosphoribosyl 1,2-cyclic phosphate phosphodiesterase
MVKILDQELNLFSLSHGYTETLGVQHGKMAYITDCQAIPENVLADLRKAELEVLLIDCLRYGPHSTHLHLDQTLEYVKSIRPKLAVLIHMGHELDYLELMAKIRMRSMKNVLPAIDGMSFLYS